MTYFLARGIEDDHYLIVQEIDGLLVETPWRVERETSGYVLSHADDDQETARGVALGVFETPDDAVRALVSTLS